jgi:hypothetical protein
MAEMPSMMPAERMTASPWSLAFRRVLADGDSLLVAMSARRVDTLRCRPVARPSSGPYQTDWQQHKRMQNVSVPALTTCAHASYRMPARSGHLGSRRDLKRDNRNEKGRIVVQTFSVAFLSSQNSIMTIL